MSIASAVARGRRAAEARMTSTATIRRKTGETTQDEDTGLEVPEWEDVYTDLPLRLASRGASGSRTRDIGGVKVETATREAHVPATTTDLSDGDLIEITAGDNAGLVLCIVEADWSDQATARRVPVVATERPSEWGA